MMVPLPLGGMFGEATLWQVLASMASGLVGYVQHRPQRSGLEDLTERLRHPVRWTLQHPIRTIQRRRRVVATPPPFDLTPEDYAVFLAFCARLGHPNPDPESELCLALLVTWRTWDQPAI